MQEIKRKNKNFSNFKKITKLATNHIKLFKIKLRIKLNGKSNKIKLKINRNKIEFLILTSENLKNSNFSGIMYLPDFKFIFV